MIVPRFKAVLGLVFLNEICEALKLNRDHSNTTNPLCIPLLFCLHALFIECRLPLFCPTNGKQYL